MRISQNLVLFQFLELKLDEEIGKKNYETSCACLCKNYPDFFSGMK